MTSVDLSAKTAARNNASLCHEVCRANGVVGQFTVDAWTAAIRTPALYPDAVTLSSRVDVGDLLKRTDSSAGCSVKDSFAALPLDQHGFHMLFEAEWIVRDPGPSAAVDNALDWRVVTDAPNLAAWEEAWRSDDGPAVTFPPTLLDEGLVFLGGYDGSMLVAGAIATASDDVVGVSNIFSIETGRLDPWPGCIEAVSDRFPGEPIVGYESGSTLTAAMRHGFRPIGPLRVWLKEERH